MELSRSSEDDCYSLVTFESNEELNKIGYAILESSDLPFRKKFAMALSDSTRPDTLPDLVGLGPFKYENTKLLKKAYRLGKLSLKLNDSPATEDRERGTRLQYAKNQIDNYFAEMLPAQAMVDEEHVETIDELAEVLNPATE